MSFIRQAPWLSDSWLYMSNGNDDNGDDDDDDDDKNTVKVRLSLCKT